MSSDTDAPIDACRLRARVRDAARRLAITDRALFARVANHPSRLGDTVLPGLTRAADHSKLWLAIAGVMAATGHRRLRRGAGRGVGSIAIASLVANQLGKRAARRDRPESMGVPLQRLAHRRPHSSSFPSGHSASAAAFAIGVGLEVPELAVPLGVLAAGVAYSRVYTGVHYPGDVLAGLAVGAAGAAALARVVPLASNRSDGVAAPEGAGQPPRPTGAGVGIVVNPGSGPGGSEDRGAETLRRLRQELPDAQIVELGEGDDLVELLRTAAEANEVLGVCGGDGTVNAAAQIAIELDRPLLVIPGGTFNHFAGDLGLNRESDALQALRQGRTVRIDVGEIITTEVEGADITDDENVAAKDAVEADGPDEASDPANDDAGEVLRRYFLNTASIGSYPAFVAVRERWEGRFGKPVAALIAARRVIRDVEPLVLDIGGVQRRVALAFFGSNAYEPAGFAPGWRPDLTEGRLDVRLIDLQGRLPRSRFALALLLGRLSFSHQYVELHERELRFTLPHADRLSFDGEVVDVQGEVIFVMRPAALSVFQPA